jgi:hypothetical protein
MRGTRAAATTVGNLVQRLGFSSAFFSAIYKDPSWPLEAGHRAFGIIERNLRIDSISDWLRPEPRAGEESRIRLSIGPVRDIIILELKTGLRNVPCGVNKG